MVVLAAALFAGCPGSDSGPATGDDVAVTADSGTCLPDCEGKQCGDDGCGGSCGDCAATDDGNWCTDAMCQGWECIQVPNDKECSGGQGMCLEGECCIPNCFNADGSVKQCGDDGCGTPCGECACGTMCASGACVDGDPCETAQCGPDGCGGSCGTCSPDTTCQDGQCSCQPDCSGKVCGPDGCGGYCGTCPCGTVCFGGIVWLAVTDPCDCVECGDDGCGGSCGECVGGKACVNGACTDCTPACAGKECGPDGCGGNCGQCGEGESCGNGQCQCQPACAGKECGGDGCGGSCGECGCGFDCSNGQCVANGEECSSLGGPCGSDADCSPPSNAECWTDFLGGFCVVPGCQDNSDCPDGSACIEVTGGSGAGTYCIVECTNNGDCREGYFCYPDVGVCWYEEGSGTSNIGGACNSDADCADAGATCYPETYRGEPTGFVEGYCIIFDCSGNSCPEGSGCFGVGDDTTACLPTCTSDTQCRKGYACDDGVCFPFCASTSDCPSGYQCDQANEFCTDTSSQCSPSNPTGWCPQGLYCIDGECQTFDFDCTDNTFEPNESKNAAETITPGQFKQAKETGMQICVQDNDWFKMTIPAGHTGTLGMFFYHELGDLDLCIYDSSGQFIACRYEYEDYPITWREYDWNDEFLSAYAAVSSKTYYFKGKGFAGAANNYDFYAWTTEYKDSDDCTDYYSFNECKGCKSNGQCVKNSFSANLMQFPHPDAGDPFVGDGYMVEHASGYSWARRELVMLIRNAIHEVQLEFPGTQPLGLMDMCQIDGITPGFDVGKPRHPETTHDEGGNIDIAYYQKNGENSGKVVCAPNGGATDGYFCTSTTNHIVDLPRTAYFLAILADSPRFRVAGVDKLLGPLIEGALLDLKNSGKITSTQYNKAKNGLAYGDGWPFHHHHIHLSLKWWSQRHDEPPIGCGYRFKGDGSLEDYLLQLNGE